MVRSQFAGLSRHAQIPPAKQFKCGSCRAPARLRRRRHRRYIRCLTHRFRSLAKARQLPRGSALLLGSRCAGPSSRTQILPATKLKCGSCRAPARLRRRRHRRYISCLTHRFRSLAKARQLPQGIGFVAWVSVSRAIASNADFASDKAQMWELSSPSETAKTAAQAIYKLPDPPLSQPR